MAKEIFYFPFYYQRFYSSTHGWTEEQEGAYLRLLTYQFDKGFIPNDIKIIKKISPKAAKFWKIFEQKFEKNSQGNYINTVMDEIRNGVHNKKEINKINGSIGGKRTSERLTKRSSERLSERGSISDIDINTEINTNTILSSSDSKLLQYKKKIFEKLRTMTERELYSDFLLRKTAFLIASAYPEKEVRDLGKLCATFMTDIKPDIEQKRMHL
jgi:uncharacterized protein YdaU (DUF1376 family)